MTAPGWEQFDEDAIELCLFTRIDLMWDELTDEDKINFAEFVREQTAEARAGVAAGGSP